jgi:hypothetical protein
MVARRTFVPSALTATLGSDPGVDSNTHPTTIPQTNRRWPSMRANFRIADHSEINANEDKCWTRLSKTFPAVSYVCQISTQEVKTQ